VFAPFVFLLWAIAFVESGHAQGPGAAVFGRVVDAVSGDPIVGAQVRLSGSSGEAPVQTTADRNGRFLFLNAPRALVRIQVEADGFLPQLRPTLVDLSRSTGEVLRGPIRLFKLGVVSGRLTDGTGFPLPGIVVRAIRTETFLDASASFHFSRTDDLGRFRLVGIPPGDYVIGVVSTAESQLASTNSRPLRPGLRAMRAQNIDLLVPEDFGSMTQPIRPRSDETGISLIPSCFYPAANEPAAATVMQVGPGEMKDGVDLVCGRVRTTTIAGAVRADTGTAAGITVRLLPASATDSLSEVPLDVARATTDASGRFGLAGVPPGTYTLVADDAKGNRSARMTIAVGNNPIGDLNLPLHAYPSVSGVVSGVNLPVRVTFEPARPRRMGAGGRRVFAEADSNGRYQVDSLPPGLYAVRVTGPATHVVRSVRSDGNDLTAQPIEIGDGRSTVDIELSRGVDPVKIGIANPEGLEDWDWTLVILPATTGVWEWAWFDQHRTRRIELDGNGAALVRGLVEGDYLMVAVPTRSLLGHWRTPLRLQTLAANAKRVRLPAVGDVTVPTASVK
jgi:hypothetical protein